MDKIKQFLYDTEQICVVLSACDSALNTLYNALEYGGDDAKCHLGALLLAGWELHRQTEELKTGLYAAFDALREEASCPPVADNVVTFQACEKHK